MSGVLPSSKWKYETGAYQALTPKRTIPAFFSTGLVDTTPYTISGAIQPGVNFDADQGGAALNIVGVSTHGTSSGFGLGSLLFFNRSRGTQASPTALQNGDPIGGLVFGGYGSGDYNLSVTGMYATATNDWDVDQALRLEWMIASVSVFSTNSVNGKTTASFDWQFEGLVGIADGSSTNPELTFTSDTNTGIYSAGADILGLATGGVDTILFSNGTVAPFLDFANTNRTQTNANQLINFDSTFTVDFASLSIPTGFNYNPTTVLNQDSFIYGAGIGFWMRPLIQNSSGSTRAIGPFLSYASQPQYQANGGSLAINTDIHYIAQPNYNVITGTVTAAGAYMFYSAGPNTLATGATVTDYKDFVSANGTVTGTLTNRYGIYIDSYTSGVNRYAAALAAPSTSGATIARTLWVGNLADDTLPHAGITMGLSADLNLYRSAASKLRIEGNGTTANGTGSFIELYNLYSTGASRRQGVLISTAASSNATGSIQLNWQGSSKGVISANTATDPILIVDHGFKVTESLTLGYVAKTGTYTLDNTNYVVDCTANTFTVTLPTAASITGRTYVIKNSGTGVITIATTSSQTIDGVTTATLSTQYTSITVMSNGSNWIII